MQTTRKPRLFYSEWLERVDMLLAAMVGKKTGNFEGIDWEELHTCGFSALEVVDAIVEELRAIEAEVAA